MSTTEPMVIVYQARNLVNGKRYIGVTKRGLHDRQRSHRSEARRGKGNLLQRAMRKYGEENFVFGVLADFGGDYELARVYEWEMICKHRPEYNLTAGGEGGAMHESVRARLSAARKGRKHSAEARARMSEAQRRRAVEHPHSAETLEKMRQAKLGRPMAPEQRAKMLGRKASPETRAKMTAVHTGRPPTKGRTGQPVPPETREKIRQALKAAEWVDTPARVASRARTGTAAAREARKIPVRCVDDGNVFESVKAAAAFYGADQMKLGASIRAQRKYRGRLFERLPKSPVTRPDGTAT